MAADLRPRTAPFDQFGHSQETSAPHLPNGSGPTQGRVRARAVSNLLGELSSSMLPEKSSPALSRQAGRRVCNFSHRFSCHQAFFSWWPWLSRRLRPCAAIRGTARLICLRCRLSMRFAPRPRSARAPWPGLWYCPPRSNPAVAPRPAHRSCRGSLSCGVHPGRSAAPPRS